jgi:ribonuclease HI
VLKSVGASYGNLVCQIHDGISSLSEKGYYILFKWVPSHSNIQGNDIADQLAKRGACGINSSKLTN